MMPSPRKFSTSGSGEAVARLIDDCNCLVDFHLWPTRSRLNPLAWLTNFEEDELPYAIALLQNFLYFSANYEDELFVAAVHRLGKRVLPTRTPYVAARRLWGTFIRSALFVHVTGEVPSPADSGHIFLRMARDQLGVEEPNLVDHPTALAVLARDPAQPVIFVDDFVGTGSQMVETWKRAHDVPNVGNDISFRLMFRVTPFRNVFYCPIVCTWFGANNIATNCLGLRLEPAHYLSERYSAFSPRSIIWPEALRSGASAFLESVSRRAGIPDLGGAEGDWRGFCGLGLAIAFEHGVPDATLPLFTWDRDPWKPLIRFR